MRLLEVVNAFDALAFPVCADSAHPDRHTVVEARDSIETALKTDEFLLDCIDLELSLISKGGPRWGLAPFMTLERTGIRFAFGYWPPKGGPGPHEHTAWTITGVCRNELEVETFDRAASYRHGTLIKKNLFAAPAGKVGFIYEPGLHAPRNPTNDWSLSIHIISPRDGFPLPDQLNSPAGLGSNIGRDFADDEVYTAVLSARQKQRWLRQLSSTIAPIHSESRHSLLARCWEMGTSMTRAHVNGLNKKASTFGRERSVEPFILRRVHENLILRHKKNSKQSILQAQTLRGFIEALVTSDIASMAIEYVANEIQFDIESLPGGLDKDERLAVGEALEESGLFQRVITA